MKASLLFGGLAGLAFGAIVGWLAFDSVTSGVGIGIAFASAVCGLLIAYGHQKRR